MLIHAVTFDFWQTLYADGPALADRRRLRVEYAAGFFLGIGASVAERQLEYAFEILLHDLEHLRAVEHAGLGAEEIGRRLGGIVGLRLPADEAERLGELLSAAGRDQPPVPAPGAREVVRALHGRVKLGLICDTGFTLGHDLYAVMESDGLAQLFDHFTFSDQTGTTKPMVRQFHHTLHRLGCRLDQAVHVGDLEPTDVVGAKRAGMRAIRVLHPGQDPHSAADAAVEDISQVLGVLKEWGLSL